MCRIPKVLVVAPDDKLPELRRALAMTSTLAELDDLLGKLDPDVPYPVEVLGTPRVRRRRGW